MQTIRPFIRPALIATATAGALLGYGAVKKYALPEKNLIPNFRQFASVVAGIGTPVCFGLSTMPALVTSALISGAGTLFFGNNVKHVPPPPSPPPPPPLPENIQKIVDDFVKYFAETVGGNTLNKDDAAKRQKNITKLSKDIKKNLKNLTGINKITYIESIFKTIQNSIHIKKFNTSDVWVSLLTHLSEATGINENQNILLAVADGKSGTIKFTFKQLKGFIEALNINDSVNNAIDTKNSSDLIPVLLDSLQPQKPFIKVLNNDAIHFTGMVIERQTDNTISVSHIDSQNGTKYKKLILDNQQNSHEYIKHLIETVSKDSSYIDFFSDAPFNICSTKLNTLNEQFKKDNKLCEEMNKQNDFTPFSQASNTCHQMAVMNLLKYYIEKAST